MFQTLDGFVSSHVFTFFYEQTSWNDPYLRVFVWSHDVFLCVSRDFSVYNPYMLSRISLIQYDLATYADYQSVRFQDFTAYRFIM